MSSDEPSLAESNGARLRDGRFGPGNSFGKGGNPFLRRIHQLRRKLLECATDDDLERIVRKLATLAAEGDVAAARLWMEYALGKAPQAIELSGADGEPLGISITQLQAVILEAVGDVPEARARLAHALRALTLRTQAPTDDHDATD